MWLCIVQGTPVKDRDAGYLTCHAILFPKLVLPARQFTNNEI
jgi:hypothetical protein